MIEFIYTQKDIIIEENIDKISFQLEDDKDIQEIVGIFKRFLLACSYQPGTVDKVKVE